MPGYHIREAIEDLGLTQKQFADALGIQRHRLNEIINGHRGVKPDTALRLARVLGTTPELWLNLQRMVDLYDALHAPGASAIVELQPLVHARACMANRDRHRFSPGTEGERTDADGARSPDRRRPFHD